MRYCIKYLTLTVLFTVVPMLLAAQQSKDDVEHRADSLYEAYKEQQALELYQKLLEEDGDNYRALWRSSFLYSRIGNRLEEKDDQKKYYNRAIELAEKALEVDSTDTQSNFVMAVAMGRKALISGARDRVAASRSIKKFADRALKYDENNAGAWHVLGRWHFKVANLNWLERTAANALFGGIPGNATNEKAAESIEKAISLNDNYILYYLDLAKVYDEMGREQQAISTCRTALDKPLLTPDDKRLKQECRELIQDLE